MPYAHPEHKEIMEALTKVLVDVARLEKDSEHITGELSAAVLELHADDDLAVPASDIHFDLRVDKLPTEILVRGQVSMELLCACCRCLVQFTTSIADKEMVLLYPLVEETAFVDLTNDLREAMILAFPRFPVCTDACRGLCPICKANLNQTTCRCTTDGVDDRWNALDALTADRGTKSPRPGGGKTPTSRIKK